MGPARFRCGSVLPGWVQIQIRFSPARFRFGSVLLGQARFGLGSVLWGQDWIPISFTWPGPDSDQILHHKTGFSFGKACGFNCLLVQAFNCHIGIPGHSQAVRRVLACCSRLVGLAVFIDELHDCILQLLFVRVNVRVRMRVQSGQSLVPACAPCRCTTVVDSG